MRTDEIQGIVEKHLGDGGGLISVLEEIQGLYGYLPAESLKLVAAETKRSLVDIYGVVTFYKSFSLTPRGKHLCSVCMGTACHVRGGDRIMQALKRRLEIGVGETTPDYQFTLERVACFGSCALAPVVVIDDKVYGRMTSPMVEAILEKMTIEDQQ